MAVPAGTASLLDIQNEFGGSNPISLSEYYGVTSSPSGIPASGTISVNSFRGKSAVFAFTIASNTTNATLSTLATAAGWNGNYVIQVTINSGVWVYSTSTGTPALTVNVANAQIINAGKIIGMGGKGGGVANSTGSQTGSSAGPAISITTSGVSVTNNSGAYIAVVAAAAVQV